nr:DExH-box ATP-dependent RNA helicase DExH8 [Tanacetum cinerariifolium]
SDPLATDDYLSNPINATKKCITLPFVDASGFNKNEVAFRLATAIKERIRISYLENVSSNQPYNGQEASISEDLAPEAPLLLCPFPSIYNGCILIFDDFDMQFSADFAHFYQPSAIVLQTSAFKYTIESSLQDLRIIWGLSPIRNNHF